MMKIKVFNIELEGIDKCGKDSVKPYLFYLEPGKYLSRARGLISQLAYAELYNRYIEFDAIDYTKNTLFVLLLVDKQDWEIRCKLTNEPDTGFSFEQMQSAFSNSMNRLYYDFNVPIERVMIFNTSHATPFEISKKICERLEYLNRN